MSKVTQEQINKFDVADSRSNGLFFIVAGLIVVVTLGVFWQVRNYNFVNFDDAVYVYENSYVQQGLTSESIKWSFGIENEAGLWQPLTWLSFMVDSEFLGLNAGGYHSTNVLFHLANTVLLFWVLFRMTGALWPSAFVAALFALHPLHVESVAWITERKDVLSTFFWLLTMLAYLRYTEHKGAGRYLLILLFFSFGLMSKAMLVTLPFVLLLLDYWPLGRLEFSQPISKVKSNVFALILEKVPLFTLAALASVFTFIAQRIVGTVQTTHSLSIKLRLWNAILSYARYLGKMVWPEKLAVLYPLPINGPPFSKVFQAGVLLVVLTMLVIHLRRRKWLTVGWLWYLGTLVPVIGIVQVGAQSMADRFTYVPLIGVFMIIAWGANEFVPKWRWRNLLLGILAVVILGGLTVRTWFQVGYWRNNDTLYDRSLSITENNHLLLHNFSIHLAKQGKTTEAMACLSESIRIYPFNSETHYNLAVFLTKKDRISEAIEHYIQVIQLRPSYGEAYNNLGILFAQQRKFDQAAKYFTEAVRIMPNNPSVRANLARINKLLMEHGGNTGPDTKAPF